MFVGVLGAFVTHFTSSNNPPVSDDSAGATPTPAKTIQEDFERVNSSFVAAAAPCQSGFSAAGAAMRTGNRYRAYDVVTRARQACVNAWENVNTVKFSSATPEPLRDKLNADLDECSHAFAQYGGILITISKVLDGDDRPSTVSEATAQIGPATNAVGDCMQTYTADLRSGGVVLPGDRNVRHGKPPRHS